VAGHGSGIRVLPRSQDNCNKQFTENCTVAAARLCSAVACP